MLAMTQYPTRIFRDSVMASRSLRRDKLYFSSPLAHAHAQLATRLSPIPKPPCQSDHETPSIDGRPLPPLLEKPEPT